MAVKPTVSDLVGWLKLQSTPDDPTLAVYQEALDAAIEDIESRCDNTFVLATGDGDMKDPANYPQKMRTAVLINASRINKRPGSPEGVAGMSDLGVVVKIMGMDPDVERLIRRYRTMNGFT